MVEEVGAQELRDGERPEAVADRLEDLLLKKGAEEGAPLGGTRGTEAATGTREGQQVLAVTAVAEDASESLAEVATVEKGVDDLVEQAAPTATGGLVAPLPRPLDLVVDLLDEAIQGRGLGAARPVDGGTSSGQEIGPPAPRAFDEEADRKRAETVEYWAEKRSLALYATSRVSGFWIWWL
jgi:hypothetical protein